MIYLFIIAVLLLFALLYIISAWQAGREPRKTIIINQPPKPEPPLIIIPPAEPPTARQPAPPQQPALPFQAAAHKYCPNCRQNLPLNRFRANGNQRDGLTKWCAACLDGRPQLRRDLKYCPNCKQNHKKTNFYRSSKTPDGLTKWCRFCHEKQHRL